MSWLLLNGLCGIAVALILTFKLGWHFDRFNFLERAGMGMIGASMILDLGPKVAESNLFLHCQLPTPFDDWEGTLLRVGCAIYFIGRFARYFRRRRA